MDPFPDTPPPGPEPLRTRLGVAELQALDIPALAAPLGFIDTDEGTALQLADVTPADPTEQFRTDPTAGRRAAQAIVTAVAALHLAGRVHGSIGPQVLGRRDGDEALQLCLTATTALNSRAPDDDVVALVALLTPWVDPATATRLRSRAILGGGLAGLAESLDRPPFPAVYPRPAGTVLPGRFRVPAGRRSAAALLTGAAAVALLATGTVLAARNGSTPAPIFTLPTAGPLPGSAAASSPPPGTGGLHTFSFPAVLAASSTGGTTPPAQVRRTWEVNPTHPSLLLVQLVVEAPQGSGRTVAVADTVAGGVAPAAAAVDTLGRPATVSSGSPVQVMWDLTLNAQGRASAAYTVHLDRPATDPETFGALVQDEQAADADSDALTVAITTPSVAPPDQTSAPVSASVQAPAPAGVRSGGTGTGGVDSDEPQAPAQQPSPGPSVAAPASDPAPSLVTGTVHIPA